MIRLGSPQKRAGRRLTALYREHAPGAFRYAYHLTGSREDADDLVQIAFMQLHRTMERGDEIAVPAAWLSTVIKRRSINLFAGRHERPDSDRVELAATAQPNDAALDAGARLDRVRALLYTLPESQHHAFVLRHWSGLSNREIAGVLETTESAVESLLVRARAGVIAAGESTELCAEVCARLAADRRLSPHEEQHLAGCARCSTADSRLREASAIAGIALVAPSIHVGHALAAATPGFTAGGAAAGATKTGSVVVLAKTAAATLAVTATVVTVHGDLHTGRHGSGAPKRQATAAAAPSHHHHHRDESGGGHGQDDPPGDDRSGQGSHGGGSDDGSHESHKGTGSSGGSSGGGSDDSGGGSD